jgi:hypothetical protein
VSAEWIDNLIENHRVTLQSGTPDHRWIRKTETEIYGEPLSEYPGEWDIELTQDDHWKTHRKGYDYSAPAVPGCLWCEDARRDRERIALEVKAEHAAMSRSEALAGFRDHMSRNWPAYAIPAAWLIMVAVLITWIALS